MVALASARELLEGTRRDVEAISSLGSNRTNAVARELESELLEAQRNLARRLRSEAARYGGSTARFTGASAKSYERQIELSLQYLQARMVGLTEAQATAAIASSMTQTVRLMEGLEQRFTGIHRPLRLRQADRMRSAVRGAQSTLLRHIPTSVDRYGRNMIGQFERIMRVGLVQGSTLDEMTAALTGHGGPTGMVSMRATVTPSGVLRLEEADIPEGLFVRHRYWAERIVRTEVIRSYNGARLEGMRAIQEEDFPDLQKKIVAILDRRTAADSIAVDGQIRGIDEMFEDGAGRLYLYPPARPNDRETVIPWRPHWSGQMGRTSRVDREALGELTPEERTAIVNGQRRGAGERPLPAPSGPVTAANGRTVRNVPAPADAGPVAARAAGTRRGARVPEAAPPGPVVAQRTGQRPALPAVPRVATEREVVDLLQGTRTTGGRPMTIEETQRQARRTVERIRRNRDSGRLAQLQGDAVAQYEDARRRGAAIGQPVRQMVDPRPSRDVEPMRRTLGQAGGNVEDLNRIMTGRTVPLGHWEPVRPVELVRSVGDTSWSIEDGNHRLRAAMDAGATEVRARITVRDENGRTVSSEIVILPL